MSDVVLISSPLLTFVQNKKHITFMFLYGSLQITFKTFSCHVTLYEGRAIWACPPATHFMSLLQQHERDGRKNEIGV